MADIKVKENKKGTVKTIDKIVVGKEKMKNKLVQAKDRTRETYQEETSNSGTEYAINKISKTTKNLPNNIYKISKYGKTNLDRTLQNIQNANQKMKMIKKKNNVKKLVKNMKKNKKAIKTADRKMKATKETVKKTTRATKRAIQMARERAKATEKTIKMIIKTLMRVIKSIIAATKALIIFLLAGGWIVLLIIIVICLIAMLVSSIFGIFFSSEDIGSTITVNGQQQVVTMNQVIADLNMEFMNKITQIQKDNPYEEYDISSSKAEWKDILAIYTVKISNGNYGTDVITLDDEKVKLLKEIFWEMNEVSFTKDEETYQETKYDIWTGMYTVTTTKVKLHIKIVGKTANEMADKYNFSQEQRKQLQELTDNRYANMWSSVIYGSSVGSNDIVEVASSQIGNIGGQPFWSWYGFNSRVEWCACFVSWCANECGYIDAGIIPKFAGCGEGVDWFKVCELWKERGFTPKSGDIIFFDWESDNDGRNGKADHVGIVEKVENNRVYTIEGNSNDSCCRRNYDINSLDILGYGTPMY